MTVSKWQVAIGKYGVCSLGWRRCHLFFFLPLRFPDNNHLLSSNFDAILLQRSRRRGFDVAAGQIKMAVVAGVERQLTDFAGDEKPVEPTKLEAVIILRRIFFVYLGKKKGKITHGSKTHTDYQRKQRLQS